MRISICIGSAVYGVKYFSEKASIVCEYCTIFYLGIFEVNNTVNFLSHHALEFQLGCIDGDGVNLSCS
ncbi:MAG TPA: hypothetical protein O0X66_07095, partial [Methanocorpusculum sp.]|nr:hypothetical protein [Methanocorpusculum sp.]